MTAILDRIGIWKCWFLAKTGKPEYPKKNVPLGARERLNKFNKLNPHYVNFQSLSRYARLTSWKLGDDTELRRTVLHDSIIHEKFNDMA